MRCMYSGRLAYHSSRSRTGSLSRLGMAKPRRMRSHRSAGGVSAATWRFVAGLPGSMLSPAKGGLGCAAGVATPPRRAVAVVTAAGALAATLRGAA